MTSTVTSRNSFDRFSELHLLRQTQEANNKNMNNQSPTFVRLPCQRAVRCMHLRFNSLLKFTFIKTLHLCPFADEKRFSVGWYQFFPFLCSDNSQKHTDFLDFHKFCCEREIL